MRKAFWVSLSAVYGTGEVFSTLVLPCMLAVLVSEQIGDGTAVSGLLAFGALVAMILIVLWSLAVFAFIIANAIDAAGFQPRRSANSDRVNKKRRFDATSRDLSAGVC